MRVVFNAPPGWPVPEPGWLPEAGWRPDPAWPAAPQGWVYYLPAPQEALERALRQRGLLILVAGATAFGVALAGAAACSLLLGWDVASAAFVGVFALVGAAYLVQGPLMVTGAARRAERALRKRPCVVVPVTSSSSSPG